MAILDRHGNPYVVEREALTTEFSSFMSATGQSFELMPDPDPILREKGEDATVLASIAADDQVTMAMQLRKNKVQTKGDYGYSPGQEKKGVSATNGSIALNEELSSDLAQVKLKRSFNGIIEAKFHGYSIFELYWVVEGSRDKLVAMVEKPRDWFSFNDEGELVFLANGEKRKTPYGKFLVVQHEPTYLNPFGLRLLTRCLWPVAFKNAGMKWTMRYLERYGMAFQVAKAPSNFTRKEREQLAGDLASMILDAVAVLPAGAEHQLVETSGNGASGHLEFVDHNNRVISKVLSCQTQASENSGTTGTYASSKTNYEVLEDVAVSDELFICEALNDLGIIYANVNESQEYPPVFNFDEAEDFLAQAELDTKRYAVGVRFKKGYFERQGLSTDEFYLVDENNKENDTTTPEKEEFSKATKDAHQNVLEKVIENAVPQGMAANEKFVSQLEKIVSDAESFEELEASLVEVAGEDLDQDEMVELLSELMVASSMFGRMAAEENSDA